MREALADLVATGLVEYSFVTNSTEELALAVPKPGFSYNWQGAVYPLCMRRYGARHTWMGGWGGWERVRRGRAPAPTLRSQPAFSPATPPFLCLARSGRRPPALVQVSSMLMSS